MLKPKKKYNLIFNRRLFLLSSLKLITFSVVVNRLYNLQIKQSEKYKKLAAEALSIGDKILAESYLQHADHFTRILNERESLRKEKFVDDNEKEAGNFSNQTSDTIVKASENKTLDLQDESEATKASKSQIEAN